MDIQQWLLFISIALVATATPGPAVLLVSTHSLSYGWHNSIVTILGNVSGLLVMSALSVAGLSVVVLNSAVLFFIVKMIGAAYLIYLGVTIWRKGISRIQAVSDQSVSQIATPKKYQLYIQGIVIALSNPKAILFTTALFPQFIDHSQPLMAQFVVLVTTFMLLSFSCLLFYAYLASKAKHTVSHSFPSAVKHVLGAGLVASGCALMNVSRT